MSKVNADGTLLDPQQHLLQETQGLTNALMAGDPRHMDEVDIPEHAVYAANGDYAGIVGGMPHRCVEGQEVAQRHRGAGTAASAAPPVKQSVKKRKGAPPPTQRP